MSLAIMSENATRKNVEFSKSHCTTMMEAMKVPLFTIASIHGR